MPSITVKNLPEPLYRTLKEQAKRRHRSLNGEIIATIEESLHRHDERDVAKLIRELERFDSKMSPVPADEIDQLRREGRP